MAKVSDTRHMTSTTTPDPNTDTHLVVPADWTREDSSRLGTLRRALRSLRIEAADGRRLRP
jgi:hypothetical protein